MTKLSWLFFLPDRQIRLSFIISLGLNVASWLIATWVALPFVGKEDFMALHKTIYFGIDWVGPWYDMFFLPLLGLIFIIVNFFISQYIWKNEEKLSHLVSWSTVFLQVFVVVTVVIIARLNI
ncbi:MAG: hypothetical protein U9P90_04585 [Patescibacteria group bacterium]|nr:hypothetical protein [Patescibacteria group bacterium]